MCGSPVSVSVQDRDESSVPIEGEEGGTASMGRGTARGVVVQLLMDGVKQRLWHGNVEAAFRDWYPSFRRAVV